MGWKVPAIHIRACAWLATRGELGVLRCFRGFSKSTLLAIYNAWRYYENPHYRILHQGDSEKTALKTSRDTKRVLMAHPMTMHLRDIRGESAFWWVPGADDERNPSMQAAGICSTVTSSRCDEAQNDDVEVPKNITNPENREKMRYRLGEQIHIMNPGARHLFVGTPHTHDSIYDQMERMGADCLTIRMFDSEHRIDRADRTEYPLPFVPYYVFSGIGEDAKLLKAGSDYQFYKGGIRFTKPPLTLIDFYGKCAWPERFNEAELLKRRRKIRTINEWDSQYQLHSKPISEIRLDPSRIIPYDVEPILKIANRVASLWLGKVKIVGMACRWDPSGAKLRSDTSAVGLVLQDEQGRRYIHRAIALTGEVSETSHDGRKIIGGQVYQLCDLIEKFHIPCVVIETNGIGGFAKAHLVQCLKQRHITCGVREEHAIVNKNKRILEAIEPPLTSNMLWAHTSVIDGPTYDQMKSWNPSTQAQADDYIDAIAGAISDTPERIRVNIPDATGTPRQSWREAGVHEAEYER